MRTGKLTAAVSLLATTAAAMLLVGCSGSISVGNMKPKLSGDKVADVTAEKLAAQTGQPKPDVSCPEDLVGEVGTTTRCTLTATDGTTLGVTVTVTSVEGSQVNFDIKVDDKPSAG
jgi:hypothetical protein